MAIEQISGVSAALNQIKIAKKMGFIPKNAPENPKAWNVAQSYEGTFFQNMLGQMFSNLGGDGPLGNAATGQDTWRSLLVEEYSKLTTARGGVGVAPSIYNHMLQAQEVRTHAKLNIQS